MTPASIIPVFGSQRPYADLNFAAGSFGLNGTSVSSLALLAGFTFTRASLAMGYDATGKLTYGPNNLCLQSGALQTTPWGTTNATVTANATAAPDGTVTAAKVVPTNATTGGRTDQSITLVAGTTYRISIYAKAAEWGWLRLRSNIDAAANVYFNLNTGVVGTVETGWSNATITSVGNGWYRCSASYVPGSTGFSLRPLPNNADNAFSTGDGTSGIYLWGAQLEAVTYQTTPSTYYPTTTAAYYGPRLVYDPVTLASQGILVEEARTNSLIRSNEFINIAWQDAGPNLATAAAAVSPDGTTNASLITATTVNSIMRQARTLVASTVYTGGFFLKAGTSTRSRILIRDTTAGTNFANLTVTWSGGVPSVSGSPTGTWQLQAVGNGWYRLTGYASTGATPTPLVTLSLWPDDLVGTGTVYCYGGSLEAGTGASSPIPTTTASVTRAADVAAVTGLTLSQAFSIVSAAQKTNNVSASANVATCSDGTNNNRLVLYTTGTVTMRAFGALAGSGVVAEAGSFSAGQPFKQAVSFDGVTTFSTAGNGGTVATASKAINTPVLTQLNIGITPSGSEHLNGTISRIRIYNRALPDAQLQSLTS